MRLWLLVLAVATATAQYSAEIPRVFAPGKEYWYEYESQALTGIPAIKAQYSGLKIKARVVMHVAEDKYVTMKVSTVDVFHVPDTAAAVEEMVPTEWVPEMALERIPTEHSNILVDSLIIPVKFRYENGLVTKLYAEAADPVWSVNIKRGIMSMLHLDMYANGAISEVDPIMGGQSLAPGFVDIITPDYTTMAVKSGFKVIEPSVMGDCEAIYSIIPDKFKMELKVVKVVNPRKCLKRVTAETGLFAGLTGLAESGGAGIRGLESLGRVEAGMAGAGAGAAKIALVEPSIAANYVLAGRRNAFLIKSGVLTAKYGLAPTEGSTVSMDGYVKQAIAFLKAEPISTPIMMTASPILLTSGLHMTIPSCGMGWMPIGEIASENPVHAGVAVAAAEIEARVRMVESLLATIAAKTAEEVPLEAPELIKTTIAIVKTIPVENLKLLVEKVFERVTVAMDPTIIKKREVLLDVVPMISSLAVPEVVTHIIKKRYVSCARAALTVSAMTAGVIPEPEMIPMYIELIKAPEIAGCMAAKRAAILGAGAVGNKIFNIYAKRGVPFTEISAVLKPLTKELKVMIASPEAETKITVIKAIGNMGAPDFLADIERIVKDRAAPAAIREQAIYACRKMTALLPKVLKRILLPVHLDNTEPLEVRVAAFKMAMECKPGMGVISAVARNLEVEPNVQVAAFVYSYLQNAARMMSCPQTRAVASMCKKALMTMKPVSAPIMTSSKVLSWNAYTSALKGGLFNDMEVVYKSRRALPKIIVSRIAAHIFGTKLGVAEVGIEMAGLDSILRKAAGPTGIIMDVLMGRVNARSILEPIEAIASGSSVSMALNEILSKVTLPVAELDALKLGIWAKLMDNEVNFFTLDKAAIVEAVEAVIGSGITNNLASGIDIDFMKILPAVDNALIMPSPMGLPLKVKFGTVTAVKVKGRIALEGFSTLAALMYEPEAVKVVAEIKPSVVSEHFVAVGVEHHLLKVGSMVKTLVHAVTPVKAEIIIKKAESKVALKVFVPKTVTPKVVLEMKPVLYRHIVPVGATAYDINRYSLHVPTLAEIKVEKVFKVLPVDMEYVVPVLGMRAIVKGTRSILPPVFYEPWALALGKHAYECKLEAGSYSPEAIVAELRYGDSSPEVARREDESSWWFWNSKAEEEVETPIAEVPFSEIIPDPLVVEPTIRKVDVVVKTVGGLAESYEIFARMGMACSADMTVHQIHTQVVVPRIAPITEAKTKVVAEAVIVTPTLIKTILAVPIASVSVEDVIAKVKVAVAPVGAAAEPVVIKIRPYIFGVDHAYPMSDTIITSESEPLKSINIHVEANIRAIPRKVREIIYPAWVMAESILYPYLYKKAPLAAVAATDEICMCVQIVPAVKKMNAMIATPYETKYLLGVPAPCVAPFCAPIVPAWEMAKVSLIPGLSADSISPMIGPESIVDSIGAVSAITTGMTYGACVVSPTKMVTLDGAVMTWPEIASGSNCDIVLAHDCSPERLYSVIATCAPTPSGAGVIIKKIKIIVPGHVVEISSGMTHMAEVVVKVNGAIVSPGSLTPLLMGSGLGALKIIKKNNKCAIHCEGLGLNIETDGVTCAIKTSPMFHRSCCGMCSHTPASRSAAFSALSPSMMRMSATLTPGAMSVAVMGRYALASPTCPLTAAAINPVASGICEVERRNMIVPRVVEGVPKVCLSIRPETICPEFCSARSVSRATVGFHCLPATDPTINSLIRASRERVLTELENKLAHIYEEVPIPTACVA